MTGFGMCEEKEEGMPMHPMDLYPNFTGEKLINWERRQYQAWKAWMVEHNREIQPYRLMPEYDGEAVK